MSNLDSLRSLLYRNQSSISSTGEVVAVLSSGAVSVAIGASVVACSSAISVNVGDTVRVLNFTVVSKLGKLQSNVPIYRA